MRNVRRGAGVLAWVTVAAAVLCHCGDSADGRIAESSAVDASASTAPRTADFQAASATQCDIGGVNYDAGAIDPSNGCKVCRPALNSTHWDLRPEGSRCGGGSKVCIDGVCKSGCYVGTLFYAPNATDPNDPCQFCEPATTTTAFTEVEGAVCGSGAVCTAGTCTGGCFINGQYVAPGAVDPVDACLSCLPSISATSWSAGAGCALATGLSFPGLPPIAVDSTSVYTSVAQASGGAALVSVPLGGGALKTLASLDFPMDRLALDAQNVYGFSAVGDTIARVAFGGGAVATLTSGPPTPNRMVADATNVYWTSAAGVVARAPLAGGAITTLASRRVQPKGVAVSGTNVYWLEPSAILSVPIAGGGVSTVATGLACAGLAVNAASAFCTSQAGTGAIVKVPLGGGTVTTLATTSSPPGLIANGPAGLFWSVYEAICTLVAGAPVCYGSAPVNDLAVDDVSVYYTVDGAIEKFTNGLQAVLHIGDSRYLSVSSRHLVWYDATNSSVDSMEVSGGGVTTVATGVAATAVAATPNGAYALFGGAGLIAKAPVAGGAQRRLVPAGPAGLVGLAVSGGQVYWATAHTGVGTVMQMPASGGTPTTLASVPVTPYGLGVDGTNAYWATLQPTATTLQSVPLAGGAISTFAQVDLGASASTLSASGLSVGPTGVTWAVVANDFGTSPYFFVISAPLGGGAPGVVWSDIADPLAMQLSTASDASGVYFAENGAHGYVGYSNATGGGLLAVGQSNPAGIGVQAGTVYWVTQGQGTNGTITSIGEP